MTTGTKIWAIVPAAGIGSRMQSVMPKQYLPLLGKPVVLHALDCLCRHDKIHGVVVGIHPQDRYWLTLDTAPFPKLLGTFVGGSKRAETVLKGIDALAAYAHTSDWVMVHDAVRPCLRRTDLDKLITAANDGSDGALLAVPITDTVKRANPDDRVIETLPRTAIWRALTPQIFKLGQLHNAISQTLLKNIETTDESAAIEHVGGQPQLVPGNIDNIKITTPEDLVFAEWLLTQQDRADK